MDGTAAIGTATTYARADHVHPTDTSRASAADLSALQTTVNNKADKGTSLSEYGITDAYTKIAVDDMLAFVEGGIPSAGTTVPKMDGTAAAGTSSSYARADHVHPTDTSRQATLVSGTNIKTINGTSLLGSGDLAVGGPVTMEDTAVDAAVDAATYLTNGSSVTITNDAPSYITINKTTVEGYSPFVVTCGSSNGTVSFSTTVYSPGSIQLNAITSLPVLAGTETVLLAGAGNTTVTFTPNSGGGGSND